MVDYRIFKGRKISDILGGNKLQRNGQQADSDGIFRGKNEDGRTAAGRGNCGKFR